MITSAVVFVGYETTAAKMAGEWAPKFEPNKNTVNAEVQKRQVLEKTQAWYDSVSSKVWLGQISKIAAFYPASGKIHIVKSPAKNSLASAKFCDIFLKELGGQFRADGTYENAPVRLFGFGIRQFVKQVAMEAAENKIRLPHEFWYGADHRDAGDAVLPTPEGKDLALTLPLFRLGLLSKSQAAAGYTPGKDAVQDCELATKIAIALNLFPTLVEPDLDVDFSTD